MTTTTTTATTTTTSSIMMVRNEFKLAWLLTQAVTGAGLTWSGPGRGC